MKRVLALSLIMVFFMGCHSVPYPQNRDRFLQATGPNWSIWLDTVIYVNLGGVQMKDFKRVKGLGFGNTPLLLLGSSPHFEPIIADGYGLTIREFLWKIHRKYGFVIDLHVHKGRIHLRVRSPEVVRLTTPN